MDSAAGVVSKPVYGPLETPEIFRTKWCRKLRDWMERKMAEVKTNRTGFARICDFCEEGFEHLCAIYAQAVALSIKPLNAQFLEWMPAKPPTELRRSSDDMLAGVNNPFECASAVVCLMDVYLQRLEAMKHGKVVSGLAWQSIPLRTRRRANELILKVEEAKDQGWWSIPQSVQRAARTAEEVEQEERCMTW